MVIASSPATFTLNAGNSYTQIVTFAIPAGTISAASWNIQGTDLPAWVLGLSIATGTGYAHATFPNSPASPWNISPTLATGQLGDIQAAAGGTLSAQVTGHANTGPSITAFTLTLTGTFGSGGSKGTHKNRQEVTASIYVVPGVGFWQL